MISKERQRAILEALLFVSPSPVPVNRMLRILRRAAKMNSTATQEQPFADGQESGLNQDDVAVQLEQKQKELDQDLSVFDVKSLLKEVENDLARPHRGVELAAVAQGYQLRTKPDLTACLKEDKSQKEIRLTPSGLETLSIVAYKQPITRQTIEEIRGVDSGGVLKTLLERNMLRIAGRSEEPGHPILYGTTKSFLEIFSLKSLKDLPSLEDLKTMLGTDGDDEVQSRENPAPPSGVADLMEHAAFDSQQQDDVITELDDSLKHLKSVEAKVITNTAETAEISFPSDQREADENPESSAS